MKYLKGITDWMAEPQIKIIDEEGQVQTITIPSEEHLKENLEKVSKMIEDTSGGGGFTGPVAFASLANTSGMGAVVSPIASQVPGDVAGSTPGSGDIGSGWSKAKTVNSLRNDMQGKSRKRTDADLFGSSKRRNAKLTRGLKKNTNDKGLFAMNSPKKGKGNIKSFKDFTKK